MDGPQAGVGMDDDLRRNGIGEAKVVGRGHSVDQYPDLVAPSDGVDHPSRIGRVVLPGEGVRLWPVIETVVDAPDRRGRGQPLQCLAHGVVAAEVEKIVHGPHAVRRAARHARKQEGFEVAHICPKSVYKFGTGIGSRLEGARLPPNRLPESRTHSWPEISDPEPILRRTSTSQPAVPPANLRQSRSRVGRS